MEEHRKYGELAHAVFVWIEEHRAAAVTSTITMLELLVQPYRLADMDRVNRFYALLSNYPQLDWIAPTLEITDSTARLRAEHNLKTTDALQAATALAASATGFVSNDRDFKRVSTIETLILDDLIQPSGAG